MRAPAGFDALPDGTWNCGSNGGSWAGGECGCGSSGRCDCSSREGSCGCGPGKSCLPNKQPPRFYEDGVEYDPRSQWSREPYISFLDGGGDATPVAPTPLTATGVSCPCDDELARCKECLEEASSQPDPTKRNRAKSRCNFYTSQVGPCGEYARCVHDYEAKLTAQEVARHRERCPPFQWTFERTEKEYCCVAIRCRGKNLLFNWETLIAHCVVVKTSCSGSREVWEVSPSAAPEGKIQLTNTIVKSTGWDYMAGRRRQHGDPWTVASACWECNPNDNKDDSDPPECAMMNDDFVKEFPRYPGADAYWPIGDNCNAFAGWVEARIIGTSMVSGVFTAWCGEKYQ